MKDSFSNHFRCRMLFTLTCLVFLLSACARTNPVTYYQLSTIESEQAPVDSTEFADLVIGIGPIRLPEFLDRPQIIIRRSPNRLQLSNDHRWVEPLGDSLAGALRDNLSRLLKTENFHFYPWNKTTPVDFQIVIELIHFEGEGHERALLEVVWSIRNNEGDIITPPRRTIHRITTTSSDYKGLVNALSRASSLLSLEIGDTIKKLANIPAKQTNVHAEPSGNV